MSNKSGVAAQVLSLPKGGGALAGLGESFAPDMHTGTANFSVPIDLPIGRNDLQPQIQLVYSSGNPNGPFGLGWGLSVPHVSRKTSKGVPRYNDQAPTRAARDLFVLSGSEDLVAVSEAPDVTSYRPRSEGLFARIEHHHGAADDYWHVQSKDGLAHTYGTPGSAGTDPAVVANPADRRRVFSWQLTRTIDRFGNRIDYAYERDAAVHGPRRWDQIYLKQIRYANYTESASSDERFLVVVDLDYEERPDSFSTHRAGFEIRTRRRCRRISVTTFADHERLVRTYELIYSNDTHNGISLLNQIEVIGHDGAATEALPPLVFGYSSFAPQRRDLSTLTGDLPPVSLAHPALELADLTGDGLPDLIEMSGAVRYWRNLGGGRFDRPQPMDAAPAGLSLADSGVQLVDADGDGRIDLLTTVDGLAGYLPLNPDGTWDRRSFRRYPVAPSFNLEDPDVRLVDLDGDGVTDALRMGTRLECFFNDPHAGWDRMRVVERGALDLAPNVSFRDPRVKLGDMSGDGLQDIVLVNDGSVMYWPGYGHGNWGPRVVMHNGPRFPSTYDPRRVLVGDVDGDGLDDLMYVDDRTITIWINQSGNAWSDPIEIRGTPPVTDADAVRLVDLLGNGVAGVLWSADDRGQARGHMFFLDLTGGVKPYLLDRIDNQMGAVTEVTYASSTRYYLADRQRVATRWQTTLSFPVHVVARVSQHDAFSGGTLTTEYSYHHGYWDGREREFRGFGRVDRRDAEVFDRAAVLQAGRSYAPPTETRTWFHQGPIAAPNGSWRELDHRAEYWAGDPPRFERPAAVRELLEGLPPEARRDALRTLRGSTLRTELYALDDSKLQDRPYVVTEALYGVREEAALAPGEQDRRRIFFAHILAQRTTRWERGDDPLIQVSYTNDYDAYGQPRSEVQVGVPRGRDPWQEAASSEPYLATLLLTEYAQRDDSEAYIIDRVARSTTYAIANDGRQALPNLLAAILDGSAARQITSQTISFYDGEPFVGLPFGQVGRFGALMRTEKLVFTEEIARAAFGELPPYLVPGSEPAWSAEYPQEFRALTPSLAGYIFYAGDEAHARGYFAATERRRYDFQEHPQLHRRGLVTAVRDALDHERTLAYDAYALRVVRITDQAGLVRQARYDYRILQPCEAIDPNGNRTLFTFTPLGLLATQAELGRPGESLGDTPTAPGTRFIYDYHAYRERSQPVSVRTIKRVYHAHDVDLPEAQRAATIEAIEYSDGFGRLLQRRQQAQDVLLGDARGSVLPVEQDAPLPDLVEHRRSPDGPPNVVVSRWQVYDNKGRVVEQYEPFFSTGWEYSQPGDHERGQPTITFYDPRGEVLRSLNPDGSEQRIVYGIPHDLADPERFDPTPWEVYTYDANDNAGRTHNTGDPAHWNTPASTLVDALGRKVSIIERNGHDPATEWYTTRTIYDIRGNPVEVIDPLDRRAASYVYDLENRPLRSSSIDAGEQRMVLDAAGNLVERRDSKGALLLRVHDTLNRPLRVWARDEAEAALTLRERYLYGDSPEAGLDREVARAVNLLGALYKRYDEAGLLTVAAYDFKGNECEKIRRPIADAAIVAAFGAPGDPPPEWRVTPFRVDWQPPAGVSLAEHEARLLDVAEYRTTTSYDALGQVKLLRYPAAVDGRRRELRPTYNAAGALDRLALDGELFIEQVAYDARGRRTLIAYGNGVLTRHAYDPETGRLRRTRTERFSRPDPLTLHPLGDPLDDCAYSYDLVGNIVSSHARATGVGMAQSPSGDDALDRAFSYDPLYRLLSASGRECDLPGAPAPWDARPHCADPTRTRGYNETYQYDPLGNMTLLRHQNNGVGFTRRFALAAGTNRVESLSTGQVTYGYQYDASGNLISEGGTRHFEWDHSNRLRVYRTQPAGAEPSVYTHYLYDAQGARVKKLVRKQGGRLEVTTYIDGAFEHHRVVQGASIQENNHLHIGDTRQRIAIVRVGAPFAGDTAPAVQYHVSDYLGSSALVIGGDGAFVSREEYTPYGETSFGGFAHKRYRFGGKERDEESGLSFHGARYYAAWLGRWISCDPAGLADGLNLYAYVRGNPLRYNDPTGTQSQNAAQANNVDIDQVLRDWYQSLTPEQQQQVQVAVYARFVTHAAQQAQNDRKEHRESIAKTGIGRFFGVKSDFARTMDRAERRAWLRQNRTDPSAPGLDDLQQQGCIGWVMRVLAAGFSHVGMDDEWKEIRTAIVKGNGQGDVMIRELGRRGWTIIYFNRDVNETIDDGNYNSGWEYRQIQRGRPIYNGLKPDVLMLNYGPYTTTTTVADYSIYDKLARVPFFVGIVDGGQHVMLGYDGNVSEFHWADMPNDPDAIDEQPFDAFFIDKGWHSGFIAVPPGSWR